MAQQATPVRTARLGRALGPEPTAVSGVVLLLPGGDEVSQRRPSPMLSAASVRALGRRLTRAGRGEGLATHVVHYGYRGWNGTDANLMSDALWAADEVVRRYGDVSVCLAGIGMGGRAALHATTRSTCPSSAPRGASRRTSMPWTRPKTGLQASTGSSRKKAGSSGCATTRT